MNPDISDPVENDEEDAPPDPRSSQSTIASLSRSGRYKSAYSVRAPSGLSTLSDDSEDINKSHALRSGISQSCISPATSAFSTPLHARSKHVMESMKSVLIDAEAVIEELPQNLTDRQMTRGDLAHQSVIVTRIHPILRGVGVVLAFMTVIFTWEGIDHLVVHLFPGSKLQILVYIVLIVVSLLTLWVSKKVTDSYDWINCGTFGFTYGSLAAAAGAWGLTEALVRLYVRESGRVAVWWSGSLIFLAASAVYTLMTKHNAMLDVASCADSLGFYDGMKSDEAVCLRSAMLGEALSTPEPSPRTYGTYGTGPCRPSTP